ncbi:MAG: ABC transporter substrate-binding protein [Holosporaceae bacterium]|jgi:putative ABC transport system substrate-binding protein|nr:ABC transporter substrate-binding protein [Holosporaceae bacterium]
MKKLFLVTAAVAIASILVFRNTNMKNNLPVVAIANLGPLKDLEISIQGIKDELIANGFVDGKTIKIETMDVAFDQSLISQTIESLRSRNPKVLIAVTTPVAQFAKKKIHDIPLIFHSITDPVAAGLLKNKNESAGNITGASDVQNVEGLLKFIKFALPKVKTIGMLCMTSDSNDATMMEMVRAAAPSYKLTVFAVPLEHPRDIPMRMQEFKGKVDLIYVGLSNEILAAMPTIAAEARKMDIPMFAAEDSVVRDGFALASYGVNSESVGRNAGKLVAKVLNGADVKTLAPVYPQPEDHLCVINKKLAKKFDIRIPKDAIFVE